MTNHMYILFMFKYILEICRILNVVWECVQVVMLMLTDIADTKVNILEMVYTSVIIEQSSILVQASVSVKDTYV